MCRFAFLSFKGTKDSGFTSDSSNNVTTTNGNGEMIMMDDMTVDTIDAQTPFHSMYILSCFLPKDVVFSTDTLIINENPAFPLGQELKFATLTTLSLIHCI